MALQISMQEALARIREGADGDSFILRFVSSGLKDKGKYKQRKCRYGAPMQNLHTPKNRRPPKKILDHAEATRRRAHVEHGTIPLTDLDAATPKYFTPLISHIVGYNQFTVKH